MPSGAPPVLSIRPHLSKSILPPGYTTQDMNTYFRVSIPESLDNGPKNQTFVSLRGAKDFVKDRVFRGPYFIEEVNEKGSPGHVLVHGCN